MTLREQARQRVEEEVSNAASKSHETNYEKLHVYRDGDVRWSQHINRTDDIIDDGADHFAPVPSVATVGTGSVSCNCDYCLSVYSEAAEQSASDRGAEHNRDEKYDSKSDAIDDAVANSDLSDIESDMLAAFDEIPVGYFNDEAGRFEVRVIATGQFGTVLLYTDDAVRAKAFADDHGNEYHYGLAIVDTETDTVDLGDRTVTITEAFRD